MRAEVGLAVDPFFADSTHGDVALDRLRGRWVVVLAIDSVFALVGGSDMGAFAGRQGEFVARDATVIAVSDDAPAALAMWAAGPELASVYPIASAAKIAYLRPDSSLVFERGWVERHSTHLIDPKGCLRWSELRPAEVGRDPREILRVIDALQMHDERGLVAAAEWSMEKPGERPYPTDARALRELLKQMESK